MLRRYWLILRTSRSFNNRHARPGPTLRCFKCGESVVCLQVRNRLSKDREKKLVKVYFNGRALEKARKVEWESQAFMWDESEPLAD